MALTVLDKVRIDEAVNEDAHLSRIMYNENVRKIRFRLPRCNLPAGWVKNAGCKNDGPSKSQEVKMQDMKMTDQITGREIAGRENTKLQDIIDVFTGIYSSFILKITLKSSETGAMQCTLNVIKT